LRGVEDDIFVSPRDPGTPAKEVLVSRCGDIYENKVTGERAVVLRGDQDSHGPNTRTDQPTSADQPVVWWQGALMTLKAHSDTTGGALGLVEAHYPAGFGPPLHVHHREDEALYILDGQLRCRRGDQEFTAGPGELVFGPASCATPSRPGRTGRGCWC
jgi:mannose-6-phosphate isomerase-like protein (cupin superfamily)